MLPPRGGRHSKRLTEAMENEIKEQQKKKKELEAKQARAERQRKRKARFAKQDNAEGLRRRVQRVRGLNLVIENSPSNRS